MRFGKRRIFVFLILMTLSGPIFSQSQIMNDPEPYFSALIVEDIDKSIKWYKTILGFKVVDRNEIENRGIRMANLRRGNALIELIEFKDSISPENFLENDERITGYFKFGYALKDFDAWVSFFKDSEVEFRGSVVKDPTSGKRTVIIKDPDGNLIQFFER